MTDYSTLTLEELYAAKRGLTTKADELQAEAGKIVSFIDAKEAETSLKKKLAAMSDPERAALAQLIKPRGIPSESKVGVPGV